MNALILNFLHAYLFKKYQILTSYSKNRVMGDRGVSYGTRVGRIYPVMLYSKYFFPFLRK